MHLTWHERDLLTCHSLGDFIQHVSLCILSNYYMPDMVLAQPFSAGVPCLNLRTQKMIRMTIFMIVARTVP